MRFPDDWVTRGFVRVDGRWIELGQSAQIEWRTNAVMVDLTVDEAARLLGFDPLDTNALHRVPAMLEERERKAISK